MKDYIFQFYNEGFGTTFYLKPIEWINKNLKNRKVINIVSIFIKILYTIVMIIFAGFMFYKKWPL